MAFKMFVERTDSVSFIYYFVVIEDQCDHLKKCLGEWFNNRSKGL